MTSLLRAVYCHQSTCRQPGHRLAALGNELGTHLPRDYKEFIQVFGAGDIGEVIWHYGPVPTMHSKGLIAEQEKPVPFSRMESRE